MCDLNVQSAGEAKEELLKNKEKAQEAEIGITPVSPRIVAPYFAPYSFTSTSPVLSDPPSLRSRAAAM